MAVMTEGLRNKTLSSNLRNSDMNDPAAASSAAEPASYQQRDTAPFTPTYLQLAGHETGVLIAEDEPLLRMDTADAFSEAGLVVFEARNADEALKVLNDRSDIRAVLADVSMPSAQ